MSNAPSIVPWFPRATAILAITIAASSAARAQCPEFGPVQYYTGAGVVTCPCFAQNEEAGAIFTTIPAADFPIDITKIGIGWGSQQGGAPASVEDSINIYGAGLPNPGGALYSFGAPQLIDGYINEFDVESLGPNTINAQPFTVTLRFYNTNDQSQVGPGFPSVVEDNTSCQPSHDIVKAQGIGWISACALGVSHNWLFYIKYKRHNCGSGGATGSAYCFGDGTGAVCPCDPGQTGGPGSGCANSFGTGGQISGSGSVHVSSDSTILHVIGLPPTTACLFFQGNNKQNSGQGSIFGDGLLCANGSVIRLGTKTTSGGIVDFGSGIGTDPLISVRGLVPSTGGTRYYQAWYRNAAAFCTSSTFNLTNGLQLDWTP